MEKYKHLHSILQQPDTVLFIGSGISCWSGLPSWSRLIEELAHFIETRGYDVGLVRTEAARGDLLQAASYGFDNLTKPQIGECIREACRYGAAQPHEIHRKIVTLGPRCYITTNYDNLIEESLHRWQPNRFVSPSVTNRQLSRTAEIVHARAIDFVFKPHGDAADSDSIILTREQYRELLPGGERNNALESLKMLLASRPIVYLGFGLRDPDFMYVRDLLANTYKGGTRDHYAIMADVAEAEVNYWRRNYGIHLIGYETKERADHSRDHTALLESLDKLLALNSNLVPAAGTLAKGTHLTADLILSLARHTARLARFVRAKMEFPLRVHSEREPSYRRSAHYQFDKFDHCPIEKFLDEGPERALLIGLPGAGKTYALESAAARFAERLHQLCLRESFTADEVTIPIIADLKLYHGDLCNLVERTLPAGLALDTLGQQFKLKIFLDSFNEMPREHWESGAYEADFSKFVSRIGKASLVIGSRTSDGLTKLQLPSYCLDQIDESFVRDELQRRAIVVSGRFAQEVGWLLQKPFYFQLVVSGGVQLLTEPHPRDIYQSFFQQLSADFESRFRVPLHLEEALSLVGYEAINRGEEAQPLANFLQTLGDHLQVAGITQIDGESVTNWLIAKSVVLPYLGARIAFFHQSVTEYLAANELARRYSASPHILKEKLTLTRWDQALFLTLSLLRPEDTQKFLDAVIQVDFALALSAAKYLEVGRDEVVEKLLEDIPRRIKQYGPFESQIESALEFRVPIAESHEPQLRKIVECGDIIGAAAVKRLVELKGEAVKGELLQSLVIRRSDYNYCCNGVARALLPYIRNEDVALLAQMADSLENEATSDPEDDKVHGFISGTATLLGKIDLAVIATQFLTEPRQAQLPRIRTHILCEVLRHRHSTEALELAGELLLRGVGEIATTIYFIAGFGAEDKELSWTAFQRPHVEMLIARLDETEPEEWAIRALTCLCQARHDLSEIVKQRASKTLGLHRAALLFATSAQDRESVFTAIAEFVQMNEEQRKKQNVSLLGLMDLNWRGHEELFVGLLRLRDSDLAFSLIDNIDRNEEMGELEIGPIEWWLEWLGDVQDPDKHWWFQDRLSSLFAEHLKPHARDTFLAEFNKTDSTHRKILAQTILIARHDLTTGSFSDDAISFLLADLSKKGSCDTFRGHLLGHTATEAFVTERLLPLLSGAKKPLKDNLIRVLRQAGTRHGRRYVAG